MVDKSKKDNAKARLQIYGRVDLILNGRHWTGAVIANKTLPGMNSYRSPNCGRRMISSTQACGDNMAAE